MNKCRKSCVKEYFNYYPLFISTKVILDKNASYLEFSKRESYFSRLSFKHLVKIFFISFLSSIAALVSMWFGYYLFKISIEFFKKLAKLIIHFCENFRFFEKFEKIVNRFPLLIKLNFRSVLFVINFLLLISQLVPVIKNYSESQTQIRLEIEKKIFLPYVRVCFDFRMAFEQIIQFNDSITNSGGKNNVSFIPTMKYNKYSEHLVQLLKENKFEEFSNHINSKFFLKSCKVSDKGKEFDCENILSDLILNQNRLNFYCNIFFSSWNSTQNNLTLNSRERFENLEKITIKLRTIKQIYLSIFHNSEGKYISESSQSFVISNSANFYFETYSIQKLNTNRYKCSEKINNSYDYSINCVLDCVKNYVQNFFGCLPIDSIQFRLILEKDLKTLRFKLCPERIFLKIQV